MDPANSQKFLIEQKNLQEVSLPSTKKIEMIGKPTYRKRLIKRVWNNYGGLLESLSQVLKINPAVVVAVLCVESKGSGFARSARDARLPIFSGQGSAYGGNGRMIIRFENHIFWKYWGKSHLTFFSAHFKFDSRRPWQGHKFRKTLARRVSEKVKWMNFHQKGQLGEWEVFEFARSKHQRFSMYSISMGMPQIMGFNHKKIGHKSVKRMFNSFAQSERNQIIGLFDFIGGRTSTMCSALGKKDFLTFAKLYNGPGRARIYADRIKIYYELFRKLM